LILAAELLTYLTYLGKRKGLYGFTAAVLTDNKPMLVLFEKAGFVIEQLPEAGVYELKMSFREK
jgi:RimJ/RimL family protein N-acetyltransferase